MAQIDLLNPVVQAGINKKWKYGAVDVCIVTFNRLTYLEKCINSLLATKRVKGKIIVHDDGSTDGSVEWLEMMLKRNKIQVLLKGKLGTARALNNAINASNTKMVIISNDDMYFYRGWDYSFMGTFIRNPDCGIVTMYDFARLNLDNGYNVSDCNYRKIIRSGMGCTAIRRKLFDHVKGFNLKAKMNMGYFASSFCAKVEKSSFKEKIHYATIPNYAVHMDSPKSSLCDRDILKEYCEFRAKNKIGKSESIYMGDYKHEG